ncbi:MAG: hypothetical protein IPN69_14595 [Acidobacteria bacterium]|nr:hypothetical protein [Acidobacteriota bacterium]
MYILSRLMILLLPAIIVFLSATSVRSQDCDYWFQWAGVDNVRPTNAAPNRNDPAVVMSGIRCLLTLEGDKSIGPFMGATHFGVSAQLPETTVEICALYRISHLFTGTYKHADGVALVYTDGRPEKNTDAQAKEAFVSYRKWFQKVEEIGIEKARELKLDPLKGSGLSWY